MAATTINEFDRYIVCIEKLNQGRNKCCEPTWKEIFQSYRTFSFNEAVEWFDKERENYIAYEYVRIADRTVMRPRSEYRVMILGGIGGHYYTLWMDELLTDGSIEKTRNEWIIKEDKVLGKVINQGEQLCTI